MALSLRTFEPVSSLLHVQQFPFAPANKDLVKFSNALVFTGGEWVVLNSDYKIVRASDVATLGNQATLRSFPLFYDPGSTDVQASSAKNISGWWLGEWAADTEIFDAAANIGGLGNSAITAVQQELKVATVSLVDFRGTTRLFSGLVGHGGSGDTDPVVAYVTRLPANNGGRLGIKSGYRS